MSESETPLPEQDCPPVVNPDQSVVALPVEEPVVLAEVVKPVPLLWPTLVTVLAAIVGAMVVSGVAMVLAAIGSYGLTIFQEPARFNQWMMDFVATEWGLALLVLPGQLTFCIVVMAAATLSPEPFVDRLGLRRGRFPVWTWPAFLLGTPLVGMAMSFLMSQVIEEGSEQLKMLENLFSAHAASLPLLLLLISVLPGLVEELLFRGFLQRRLLARLPVVAAIGITTVFFAAAHMDPMHAIGVAPLGIWLGVVAWRADSIWPAVLGHIGNNGFAIAMSVLAGPAPSGEVEVGAATAVGALLILVNFVVCLILLAAAQPARASTTPPVLT
jgi:uncharacterized protein